MPLKVCSSVSFSCDKWSLQQQYTSCGFFIKFNWTIKILKWSTPHYIPHQGWAHLLIHEYSLDQGWLTFIAKPFHVTLQFLTRQLGIFRPYKQSNAASGRTECDGQINLYMLIKQIAMLNRAMLNDQKIFLNSFVTKKNNVTNSPINKEICPFIIIIPIPWHVHDYSDSKEDLSWHHCLMPPTEVWNCSKISLMLPLNVVWKYTVECSLLHRSHSL